MCFRLLFGALVISIPGVLNGQELPTLQKPVTEESGLEKADQAGEEATLEVRLTPLRSSFLATTFGRDLDLMHKTNVYKTAVRHGVDLPDDLSGYLLVRNRGQSWFYIFHNTVSCDPAAKYLVQRVHKRIGNYPSTNAESDVTDHYLVEAVKCSGNLTKRPDQHYASYSLRGNARRIIEKTFEVGEVEPENESDEQARWPYDPKMLFHQIQGYSESKQEFDAVKFKRSVKWTIRVELDETGRFELQVPELGIHVMRKVPIAPAGVVVMDSSPENLKLIAGRGCSLCTLGTPGKSVESRMGLPIRRSAGTNNPIWQYGDGLAFYFSKERLVSIYASRSFLGSTAKGIKIGDPKSEVIEAYGKPLNNQDERHQFPGLEVTYKDERVVGIRITPQKRPPN